MNRGATKPLMAVIAIFPLLAACSGPFWDCRVKPESEPVAAQVVESVPFRDDELVAELNGVGLNARLIPRGILVDLDDLSFESGKANLPPKARMKLRDIAKVLSQERAMERPLAVEGHTDSLGNEATNLALSKKRAEAVAQELIFNRIQPERISVEGYGEQRPIAPNTHQDGSDDPEGRAKNRRVELIIGGPGSETPASDLQQ